MSISASLDIVLANKLKSNSNTSAVSIIDCLVQHGWEIYDDGLIVYLPYGDDGDYNWKDDHISQNDFFQLVKMKELNKEVIGVEIRFKNTQSGGELLIFNNRELSFNISINQRFIDANSDLRILDVNWYVERIVRALSSSYTIVDFSVNQFGC